MALFRCYDNSDAIATLIATNFQLYLIQLWWQFFQMFVLGDVVYAQTWQVLPIPAKYGPSKTVSSHFHMPVRPMLLHRPSFLFDCFVKLWATCKILGGKCMVYRPPWQKIARTPMIDFYYK